MRPSLLLVLALFSSRALAQTVADTGKKAALAIPGTDLPFQFDLRLESSSQSLRNLRCTSLEVYQASTNAGCNARLQWPDLKLRGAFKSQGIIGDRVHVNIDYDMQREFDASQTVSLYYVGDSASRLRRVDVGNIDFIAPPSRFLTSALPSGNYGFQVTNQFGRMSLRSIFAKQTGNVVQNKHYDMDGSARQRGIHDVDDYQIERLRFFFTIDPQLLGRAYPNIDILNRRQMDLLAAALPDTLRPTRVLLYRLQFGAQPQNPNGPRFRVRGDPGNGRATYDLLREGVDYVMDRSNLWFALVRPLNETNERLVVAYNVRINGRDTIWASTGGTPDLTAMSREQIANLIFDPTVRPSSPEFRNEIRSAYRVAGEDLVRNSVKLRVVTGSGLLEHPLAGNYATFLQMFGLAQPTNPAEFDYENRLWPRRGDGAFNLSIGAPDVRNGATTDIALVIRDYFLVFPSLHPFAARDSGLVVAGNPTNDPIYTTPGEYLYSPQHPASVYRFRLDYQTIGTDQFGAITLGATQMRRGSERVLLDGRPLLRDLDYRINYDIGQLEFTRADTLFRLPHRVDVSYEENPVFAGTPTTLAGFVSELPFRHGTLNFTAINQSQSTPFTQPQLGFQGNSTLTAGLTGQFAWELPAVSSFMNRLPFASGKAPSKLAVQGELASTKPQFAARNNNQAYVEVFEADGGTSIPLSDLSWNKGSLPAYGHSLQQFGASFFEPAQAAAMVWQTNVKSATGRRIVFTRSSIDPLLTFTGSGIETSDVALWMTLLPRDQMGAYDAATHTYNWSSGLPAVAQRFGSIRTTLSPSGVDLSRNEQLEFWTLLDTTVAGRLRNPTMIFDFGDVSENALSFGPRTLSIRRNANGTVDSLFSGRKLQGFDSLNTERDPFSHAFNADVNDTGLPGDVVDTLTVSDETGVLHRVTNARICRGTLGTIDVLGDPHTNCTVRNGKLDEEDIDLDNALNFSSARRESERLLRYVVDLRNPSRYKRVGGTFTDTVFVRGVPQARTRRWVLVSVPFDTPTETLNDVDRRRIRALRLTLVSSELSDPNEPLQLPIADMHVTGAPWINRSTQTLAGLGGIRPDGGFVVLSSIGTNDSTASLVYQPPPGVIDQADTKLAQFSSTRTAINETSMRVQAGNMPLYHRAEAYLRFPAGPQFFLGFEELRVWGRGHGNGWGQNGELQMYVKVGRDENNFYMRRAPMSSGPTPAAWTDVDVSFQKFVQLGSRIQAAYLAGNREFIGCTGVDSALVVSTPLPPGVVARRFAACDNGYIAYTVDPAVSAPNLAAVQEIAVGLVRVANGGGVTPVLPGDTLELWVDDIRLNRQVNNAGLAGQIALQLNAGDFADFRMTVANRDANFRQLGEQASFMGQRNVDLAMTLQLQKLLPSLGLAMPLTITKTALGSDPRYLSQSDIDARATAGLRKPKNDLTTYTFSLRPAAPIASGMLGTVLNNLAATSTYVTGVDRTEFQNGNAHNLSVSLDYLITPDTALRLRALRWNPTQLRFTSGLVRGDDKRVSFLLPSSTASDQPTVSTASSRLWRNASALELRPTNSLSARWEFNSLRDFRDYRDSAFSVGQSANRLSVQPGFERERTIMTAFSFTPIFSNWVRPRAELGTQYSMLRDPNVRWYSPLPGVLGVDSVLASRDSIAIAQLRAVPRRMTAAQTASIGTLFDVAAGIKALSRDSSMLRRIGNAFSPFDVSYTRSLLSALDASPVNAPMGLQFGLAGPDGFRTVSGVQATTAGQTGVFNVSGALLLPYGTAVSSRYRRTNTLNWIGRADSSLAHVDGSQTQFPDVTARWTYRPTGASSLFSTFETSAGFVRNDVTVSLPNLFAEDAPEIRHTHADVFPFSATIAWGGRSALSTSARYSLRRQIDSLPGSISRSNGNDLSVDAGRAFRVPEALGLGLKGDLRTRLGVTESHNTTFVYDPSGVLNSRLQDQGRQGVNLAADTNLSDAATFTLQGSYVIWFDNNLNRRYAQTVLSMILQFSVFGASK